MNRKVAISAAAIAAAAGIAFGVTSLAEADPSATPTSSASAPAEQRGGTHTEVTGDELTKVTDAVNAKISGLTIDKVLKDEDGSYDVKATKPDGTSVKIEVSADLATIEEKAGRPGKGGGTHIEVTGDELTKVTDAVNAKISGLTIDKVLKDEDGSYDVKATKADGTRVMIEVSADLSTIEERAARAGKGGGGHAHTEVTGDELTKVTDAVNAKISGLTIDKVLKDEDGSYDVKATKADGTRVMIEVSADLATVTEKAGRPDKASGAATPTPTP